MLVIQTLAVSVARSYAIKSVIVIKGIEMAYNVGNPMFKGSLVALITPFANGVIDESAFKKLVSWQIEEGTDGLIPVGTTGESQPKPRRAQKGCGALRRRANGRVSVIAGAGSNSTAEAIEFTKHAKAAGADAALHVTPYYNKPTQEGMYRHFMAIADAVDLPIIIYNIPPRSVIDMSLGTMKRLSEHSNIVGVKDATQDLVRPLATRLEIGPDFCQLRVKMRQLSLIFLRRARMYICHLQCCTWAAFKNA